MKWPFKKKKDAAPARPKTQDDALCDLSRMFLRNPDGPTPFSDLLKPDLFDFSVESLRAVDAHLEQVRTMTWDDQERDVFILRCGAYVGEVIRRFTPSPKEWHWLAYKDAAAFHPFVASLGMSVETAAVLWDGNEGVIFPLAKVSKYLANGSEDSVWFYAQVLTAGPPIVT